jgi:hypothetical protein
MNFTSGNNTDNLENCGLSLNEENFSFTSHTEHFLANKSEVIDINFLVEA